MLLKEVEAKIFEGINKRFSEMGFSLRKSEYSYDRKLKDGNQLLYFIFNKKEDGIYIEPRWAIKLKNILDIYHLVATKEKKYFKYTPVLANSLGELIEYKDNGNQHGSGKSFSYLIENDQDTDILIKVIPKRFEEYALPYFNDNSSVKRVDELLNTTPEESSIHNWLYPLRACMGIIAAKLVNNPSYNNLLDLYWKKVENANPLSREEFIKLVDLLKNVEPIRILT